MAKQSSHSCQLPITPPYRGTIRNIFNNDAEHKQSRVSHSESFQSSRTYHTNHTADTNRHCGSSRCREKGETAASDDSSTTDPNTGFRFELLPVMRAAALAHR